MRIQATFTSKHFGERRDYVLLHCRETGDSYSFTDAHPLDSVPVFRNGKVIAYRRGKARCLGLIESDARWQIRADLAEQRAALTGRRDRPHVWA